LPSAAFFPAPRNPGAGALPESDRGAPPVRQRRLPRSPALDGLRGLAIAAVILFHYPTHLVFVGGLFGVGVFFVLSGFLITSILTEEHSRLETVHIGAFLRKRARRLLPALVVFLVVMLAATAAFGHRGWFTSSPFGRRGPGSPLPLSLALKGAAAGLSYTYNLFLAHDAAMPAPFGHLWTLAVEGQFYLCWPLVVGGLLRWGPKVLLAATIGLIAVSAISPFLVWDHGARQTWIYFDSVPRIQELMAGALLAQLWSQGVLRRVPVWVLRGGAAAGGAVLVWVVFKVANVPFKYLGALTVVAGAGMLVVAYIVDERTTSPVERILGSRPIVWLGQRSYGLYLWHWPFAEWTNQMPHRIGVPLGITCAGAAAELSWRLVEAPGSTAGHLAWLRARSTAGRGLGRVPGRLTDVTASEGSAPVSGDRVAGGPGGWRAGGGRGEPLRQYFWGPRGQPRCRRDG
jgi:peptidoglycan/LPS O-acetylase OafA/YrhL